MQNQIELSIIILCYRSEENVIDFANEVKKLVGTRVRDFEIILVGNYIEGTTDRTKEIVQQLANNDPIFKAICKPKKGMMGWDMKEGMKVAIGKYLCVIDGDGQFPIASIIKCLEIIKEGNYPLVKTYRSKRNDGLYRLAISKIYNLFFQLIFPRVKSFDVNSKPKMLTKSLYNRMCLTSDDWFIDAEIMLELDRLKEKYFEFPIEFSQLTSRVSFVKFGAIFEFIVNLISYRLKHFRFLP